MSLAWPALERPAAKRDAVGNESAIMTTATRNEPFIASSPPAPRLPALDPDRLAGLIALRYATWAAPLCAGRLRGLAQATSSICSSASPRHWAVARIARL